MSSNIVLLFFIACSLMLLFASARKMDIERKTLVDAAIEEVEKEFSETKTFKLSKSQQKLRAFKMATPKAKAQGLAALKFERMVNLAEKKILQSRRQANAQTTSSLAEALATELLHKPGTVLTAEEIARLYTVSECITTILPSSIDCSGFAVQKHRTADGTCNNLANPTYGAAGTPLRRLIPARYDDGISRPRGFLQNQRAPFVNGPFEAPYPSPRVVSLGIVGDREVDDTMHSLILMQWGQFIDHDLDAVPEHEGCPPGCDIAAADEGACYPFPVPRDDNNIAVTQTGSNVTTCFTFMRSLPACPSPSQSRFEFLPREQQNVITHFIDGSMVYHHDPTVQDTLIRDPNSDDGLLRTAPPITGDPPERGLLPDAVPADRVVLCPPPAEPCFLAGDLRVNEQTALTVMHTIWVREHNRIARVIRQGNPSFTSTKVFLTTRDIVGAMIQKITYQDFLPILFGDSFSSMMPPYDAIGYDPTIDPSVPNSFASAAYRFGHSQIQPFFERLNDNYESIAAGPLSLVDSFFDTSHVRDFGTDAILRGLVSQPARKVDEFLTFTLTNRLFADDENTPGLDLASLNVQRGRDHGLPAYLTWKQYAKQRCGVESYFRNQLTQIHLLQTYGGLESVDLFVGGLAEEPLPGGLVGAVFGCIFAQTFLALRHGDRFYYENADPATALFTDAQRQEIGKASLSRVICDNTGISQIQSNAFLTDQLRVNCNSLPSIDLSVFTEAQLPIVCYAKVHSNGFTYAYSLSRASDSSKTHFNGAFMSANSNACYAVLCPPSGGTTNAGIVASRRSCSHQSNTNLPPSTSSLPRVYRRNTLEASDFLPANGIYTSISECEAGTVTAVDFTCGSQLVKAEEEQQQPIDVDADTREEVEQLTDDDEGLQDFFGGGSTSKSSSKEDRLIGLMEEMLQTLKTKKDERAKEMNAAKQEKDLKKDERAKEMNAVKQEKEDNNLVSELEQLLKKVK